MTDHATNGFTPARTRAPSFEYRCYFAIIFLVTLPWAFIGWALGLAHPGGEDAGRGFIARAWHQASVITPMIFAA
ncbi:MAG: cytochrome PufQ [Pseudomonadota bacterium]